MDFREKKDCPNPRENASLLSKLFFLWIFPLFRKGSQRDLVIDDMYNCLNEDISDTLGTKLGKEWDERRKASELKGRKPKFYKSLIGVFGKTYMLLGLAVLFDECVTRVAQPIFLRLFIRSFADKSIDMKDKYWYACGICFTSLAHALIIHPLSFAILHIGMKCRVSSSSLIYRKALRLSHIAQGQTTVGQLVNLLSNDVNRFDYNVLFIPYLYIGPIQTVIFVYFLWEELGVSCLAGIGFVFLLMPLQYYIGKLSRTFRSKIAQKADERGRIMNEIIIAMRVIKMYAWEKPFSTLVNSIRLHEVKVLRKRAYLRSFYLSLYISSSKLIPFLTFLTYVLFGNTLTADKVFFTVAIFNVIIQNMISTLPSAAAGIGELIVATNRIETFLLLDEQKKNDNFTKTGNNNDDSNNPSIHMGGITASWTGEKLTLDGITATLTGNQLVMIVGPVGSGKTSLLQALLAELPIKGGKCTINGPTAYASQEPWIFTGNIRQNIIFGRPYDENRYQEVLSVCALESDLYQLPFGDMTIVGERGIMLSGGQKARVNLARAMYQYADIYLLDDPLSAVDSRVSRHIFEKCIKKYLRDSLRILVTHQLQYLPQADHVLVFNHGRILAQGTYTELVEQGVDFVGLMTGENEEDTIRKASITKMESISQEIKKKHEKREEQSEKMAAGSVTAKTYWTYFRSGDSLFGMFLVFSGFLVSQLLYSFSEYWLSFWTNHEEIWAKTAKLNTHGNRTSHYFSASGLYNSTSNPAALEMEQLNIYLGQNFYICVYCGLVIAIIISTNVKAAYFFKYCMRISINVHNRMFSSLVRAPTKFFDDNPSGRIMNRFTKDLGSMDENLPSAFFDVLSIFLLMVGVVIIVIVSNYFIIIPSALIIIALWLIRRFYIQTARDVKRIEAITRSPLFTHLAASIQGLTTIRSSNTQNILIKQYDGHQDLHSSAWFLFISSNRWFGIWLEMISVVFLIIVTYSFLVLSSTMSGNVGLAISSVLTLTGTFQWGMRQSAEMENLMTSVERTLEYVNLEPEAPLESHEKKSPAKGWPFFGSIKFKHVSLAYKDKLVLKDLTFDIGAKEKIGIVGRTGAGKSSIIAALFRMTEPSGEIFIDDVCINDIGLHDLRKRISIIPQDPVLFSGTIRYNLDPFGQFSDCELWQVLEEVELKDDIPALDFKVSDGGSNFSLGQRQLVCLARAILRKNRILVMDEATANVDPRTDSFIQETIRTKFADCSIITIAHRLHSVMDCDKILVLDGGRVKEYDHPHILLNARDGLLTSMVRHTGKAGSANLKQIAQKAYETRAPVVPTNYDDNIDDNKNEIPC